MTLRKKSLENKAGWWVADTDMRGMDVSNLLPPLTGGTDQGLSTQAFSLLLWLLLNKGDPLPIQFLEWKDRGPFSCKAVFAFVSSYSFQDWNPP